MVKLKGQLLSLDAKGSLGKTITYSTWKGRSYAKKLGIPTNNQQAAQLGMRAGMTFLSKAWSDLTPLQQATWIPLVGDREISPFDAYIGDNLTRLANDAGITQTYPGGGTLLPGLPSAPTFIPFATFVEVTFGIFPPANPFCGFLYRSPTPGFTAGPSNVTAIPPMTTIPTLTTFQDVPPTHGTWYYQTGFSDKIGNKVNRVGETTVVF